MIRQCVLASVACVCPVLFAQKPAFDVVSVKLNTSGQAGGSMGPRGDSLFATNMPLRVFLLYAFAPADGQLLPAQLIGEPSWANTDRFDIQGKVEGEVRSLPIQQTRLMMQSLLEDRFHLKAHRERRELPVYNLVLVKGGPRLSADQTPPDPRQGFIDFASPGGAMTPLPRGAMRMINEPSGKTLVGTAITVSRVLTLLQGQSDRMIIDKTGFQGLFDINLQFTQSLSADSVQGNEIPSLSTAIQDLGLKLEPAKALEDVVVIDSVQKPSQN